MKRSMTRVLSVCLTMVFALAFIALPTFAAGITYTPITGSTVTFDKYLVLDADAQVPNATFTFAIAPGTASTLAADGTTLVLAGPTGASITANATMTFSPSDNGSKLTTVATGDDVTLDEGEAYVKKTVTVSFASVSFNEPGVYRWLVTEAGTNLGIANDTQRTAGTALQRTLDVYVTDNNGTLEVSGYVLHEKTDVVSVTTDMGSGDVTTDGDKLADKSGGFVNEYSTYDLQFGKEVEGNQGSKDKYFEFTLEISGAVVGTKYTVDLSNADASPTATAATTKTVAANPAELTVGDDGKVTQKFYLKDGQYINVLGIAAGTTYKVTEDKEDYKSADGTDKVAIEGKEAVLYVAEDQEVIDGTAQVGDVKEPAVQEKLHDDATNGTMNKNVYTGFTNTRDGFIPTGVFVSIIPAVAILGVAGFTAYSSLRKKEDEEE